MRSITMNRLSHSRIHEAKKRFASGEGAEIAPCRARTTLSHFRMRFRSKEATLVSAATEAFHNRNDENEEGM